MLDNFSNEQGIREDVYLALKQASDDMIKAGEFDTLTKE